MKEVKIICGCFFVFSNNEEFLVFEKKFSKRFLRVFNLIVMLELFFWFLILEVEVEFWLIDDKKLKFFFKIINYSKCYDWVEDMLCIGLLKEFY